jgi:hypothetical protein
VAVSPKRLRFLVSWAFGISIRIERWKINNIGIRNCNNSLIFFAHGDGRKKTGDGRKETHCNVELDLRFFIKK